MRKDYLNGKMVWMLVVFLALFMATDIAREERTDASEQGKHAPANVFSYAIADTPVSNPGFKIVASNPEPKTIAVSTAEAFVDAIDSNTTIILSSGVYNLSQVRQDTFATGKVSWEDVYDGRQLVINDIHNLTIQGESSDCQIHVDPRYADVLSFFDCTGITIENITFGHTIQSEPCEGRVLCFENCSDIQLINTHMFGCGTDGLCLDGVIGATIENSSIYDCTVELLYITDCHDITFTNCVFRDTTGEFNIEGTDNVTIDRCRFTDLTCAQLFYVGNSTEIVVKNSSFTNNFAKALDPSELIRFENNTYAKNSFAGAEDATSVDVAGEAGDKEG